jgi:molybdenum cofactor cytidylyltransferase
LVESGTAGVGAVVLAAGSSSRMGTPKQLLQFQGQTLLTRAALAALGAGCRPVVVVTGAYAVRAGEELRGLDVLEVVNELWETGMASSVRAGVGAVLEADAEASAVVLTLCDQPHVTSEIIAALINAHRADDCAVVACEYGGAFGVPALFGRSLFPELMQLEGQAGAKQVIKRHAREARFVAFPEGETDVDTPDDFARLLGLTATE